VAFAAQLVFFVLSIQLYRFVSFIRSVDGPCVANLPDYSRVVLNSGSSLWYMNYFLLRNVHLDGEAYFEVQKGSTFSVRANDGMVQVLGTRFDVSEKGGDLHVNCYEGRVSVTRNGNNEVLAPGEFVEMSDNSIVHSVQRIEQYPYYALFNRDFDRVKLEQVFHEIEAFFGVKINSHTDKNRVFSGRIVSGDVDAVLEIVCQSMRLDYTREKINKIEIYEL
jgi:ferric-dicitrate binding protein FerR (iron transport regulator)